MKRVLLSLVLVLAFTTGCAEVDLNAPIPAYDPGVDPGSWVTVPAGTFLAGQQDKPVTIDYDYQMMVTDVTVAQYVDFLNRGLADGTLTEESDRITGVYPGDPFHGAKHEIQIDPGLYLLVPLNDPASPFIFDGETFASKADWENHPMVNVSWFGAWTFCDSNDGRLPTEMEWEKAARGSDDNRPFPWGDRIARNNANYYKSGDPFENMSTVGSRTSPVGFYNGRTHGTYVTLESASPYGLYDMGGNVWQWVGDVLPGWSDRLMHGGSAATYDMDLRIWVRNSAPPMHYGPDIGFRCAREP